MAKKKETGYIKLNRDFMNDALYDSGRAFTLMEVYLDLNLRALYTDYTHDYKGHIENLRRGQIEGSIRQFADWWHMTKDTAMKRLNELERAGYIYKSIWNKRTVITLPFYSEEQDSCGMKAKHKKTDIVLIDSDIHSDNDSDIHSDNHSDNESDINSDNYKKEKKSNKESIKKEKETPTAGFNYSEEELERLRAEGFE